MSQITESPENPNGRERDIRDLTPGELRYFRELDMDNAAEGMQHCLRYSDYAAVSKIAESLMWAQRVRASDEAEKAACLGMMPPAEESFVSSEGRLLRRSWQDDLRAQQMHDQFSPGKPIPVPAGREREASRILGSFPAQVSRESDNAAVPSGDMLLTPLGVLHALHKINRFLTTDDGGWKMPPGYWDAWRELAAVMPVRDSAMAWRLSKRVESYLAVQPATFE